MIRRVNQIIPSKISVLHFLPHQTPALKPTLPGLRSMDYLMTRQASQFQAFFRPPSLLPETPCTSENQIRIRWRVQEQKGSTVRAENGGRVPGDSVTCTEPAECRCARGAAGRERKATRFGAASMRAQWAPGNTFPAADTVVLGARQPTFRAPRVDEGAATRKFSVGHGINAARSG